MARTNKFVMRVSQDEKQTIKALAERLQRTESDAVRWVLSQAHLELTSDEPDVEVKDKANAG